MKVFIKLCQQRDHYWLFESSFVAVIHCIDPANNDIEIFFEVRLNLFYILGKICYLIHPPPSLMLQNGLKIFRTKINRTRIKNSELYRKLTSLCLFTRDSIKFSFSVFFFCSLVNDCKITFIGKRK